MKITTIFFKYEFQYLKNFNTNIIESQDELLCLKINFSDKFNEFS